MIVKATASDAEILTEIALKSKAYWGYANEQIESWREDLKVSPDMFEKWEIYKFILEGEVVGFHILNMENQGKNCELEFLFILPNFMGKGVGSRLLNHAFELAINEKKTHMDLLADPNAMTFYAKYGFKEISKKESSIPGRFLPIMQKEL